MKTSEDNKEGYAILFAALVFVGLIMLNVFLKIVFSGAVAALFSAVCCFAFALIVACAYKDSREDDEG